MCAHESVARNLFFYNIESVARTTYSSACISTMQVCQYLISIALTAFCPLSSASRQLPSGAICKSFPPLPSFRVLPYTPEVRMDVLILLVCLYKCGHRTI